jgi:hypothetical protein
VRCGKRYYPDVPDPVACDVEREHRHGDAVLLSHQPWLAQAPQKRLPLRVLPQRQQGDVLRVGQADLVEERAVGADDGAAGLGDGCA